MAPRSKAGKGSPRVETFFHFIFIIQWIIPHNQVENKFDKFV